MPPAVLKIILPISKQPPHIKPYSEWIASTGPEPHPGPKPYSTPDVNPFGVPGFLLQRSYNPAHPSQNRCLDL
ncbi:MAG: hypothetical protein AMXMBFR60_30040 [Chloroflexota bacterium]|nr:hypothetical protein [Anaerolineales bacterium]NUQ59181.1 hypothetical protein [Anaerolineales bacterium]